MPGNSVDKVITYRDHTVPTTIGLVRPQVKTAIPNVLLERGSALVTTNSGGTGFTGLLRNLFKQIKDGLAIIFNISSFDNTHYIKLYDELEKLPPLGGQKPDDKFRQNVESLYVKSLEAVYYGQKQKENGHVPWEEMPENIGVPMSAKQGFLSGGSPRQRYLYNLSLNLQASAILNGYRIETNKDIDNSQRSKAFDPEDTARLQSVETTYWLEVASRLGNQLGIAERHITARGGHPAKNLIRPIGQNPNVLSPANLNGAIEEIGGGRSLRLQEEALERMGVNIFNSTGSHTPNEPLFISHPAQKVVKIYRFLRGTDAPRVNGKTFLEALAELVDKKKCCVFELKAEPRYILETKFATSEYDSRGYCQVPGEVYRPHYIRICRYKEEEVDEPIQRARTQERDTQILEKQAWINFAKRVKHEVDSGKMYWRRVDGLHKELSVLKAGLLESGFSKYQIAQESDVKNLTEQLETVRKKALQYIRLPGSDKPVGNGALDLYKFIDEKSSYYNPQAFFDFCKEAETIAMVVHDYDPNETPVEEFTKECVELFDQYANLPETRTFIGKLNMELDENNELHPDIERFVEDGVNEFVNNGVRGYLDWRMIQHLTDHCTEKELSEMKFSTGEKLFDLSNGEIKFSQQFAEYSNQWYFPSGELENPSIDSYVRFLKDEFVQLNPHLSKLSKVIDTFIPSSEIGVVSSGELSLDELQTLASKTRTDNEAWQELSQQSCFYPNQLYSINSTCPYTKKYSFHRPICLVIKSDEKNKQGQYYMEVQPEGLKKDGLRSFEYIIDKKIVPNTVGDSKGDIPMHAGALLRGGYIDIVLNVIQKRDIYKEIIKQRLGFAEEFANDDELYQACRQRFGNEKLVKNGFSALEEVKVIQRGADGKNQEVKRYKKILKFSFNENARVERTYEKDSTGVDKLYMKEELIEECNKLYSDYIIENESPEAYVRRQAEIYGLFTRTKIEYDPAKHKEARVLYDRKSRGELLNAQEQALLSQYERIVVDEKKGYILPDEAPSFDVYRQWWGQIGGNKKYCVYRSKSHDGKLVIDYFDGKPLRLFEGSEADLAKLSKVNIRRNHEGKFICLDENGKAIGEYTNIASLNDHVCEHSVVERYPEVEGLFANKFLTKLIGEQRLKRWICNLPNAFRGLMNVSGLGMLTGALIRLASPAFGGMSEGVFKFGYRLSNGIRAVACLASALRGQITVHKYHAITIGELLGASSALFKDGPKHIILGVANMFLFMGRAQQTEQRTQKNNSHLKKVLDGKLKVAEEADPRPPARTLTRLATRVLQQVKEATEAAGLNKFAGEMAGSVTGAVLSSVQMVKDIFKDPRLILQIAPRLSEKSGEPFRSIPSPGHLLNIVGLISGLSAMVAGTFGRSENFGSIDDDSSTNTLGRIFTSIATGFPILGIIANARDVMANQQGIPRVFGGFNGKDANYNPLRAGLCQIAAGIGIGLSSLGKLSDKYIASIFDAANGLFYVGAAEEDVANTNQLVLSILRRGQKLYQQPQDLAVIDFNGTSISGKSKEKVA